MLRRHEPSSTEDVIKEVSGHAVSQIKDGNRGLAKRTITAALLSQDIEIGNLTRTPFGKALFARLGEKVNDSELELSAENKFDLLAVIKDVRGDERLQRVLPSHIMPDHMPRNLARTKRKF